MQNMMQMILAKDQQAPRESTSLQPKKPDRPIINTDATDNDWAIFLDAWGRYKAMMKLDNPIAIRQELRLTCSNEVNKMLFNFKGPDTLNAASETEMLTHIKSVAVKGVHQEVHRQRFKSMRQQDGEMIVHFVSRLKAQAMLCAFNCTCKSADCETENSYVDDMISSQIIAGLQNSGDRSKILAEIKQMPTLSDVIDRLLTLECSEKAMPQFQLASDGHSSQADTTTAAVKSQYQRGKANAVKAINIGALSQPKGTPPTQINAKKCRGCGRTSHPNSRYLNRKDCPAQGKPCRGCGKLNHFESVCESSKIAMTSNTDYESNDDDETSYIFSATSGSSQ